MTPVDLSHRHDLTEMMDGPDISAADYAASLRDLASVNWVTRTHAPVLAWLNTATKDWPPGQVVSVLDVASGHGDLLRAVHRWATKRGLVPRLAGVDLNPRSAIEAQTATPDGMHIAWQIGDVFDHVPDPLPDFIISSQFAHHLTDAQAMDFLLWLDKHAARGWLIADIHRHVIPYYGFRVLCWIARWHRIVRLDGTISVARSFTPSEWRAMLDRAGLAATVKWHALFRITIAKLKS